MAHTSVLHFLKIGCGILIHILCLSFTVIVGFLSRPGASLFSWHPFLMSLAISCFMTEGLLLFSPHISPVWMLSHKIKVVCHWILQVLCVMCTTTGFFAIFYNKVVNGKPHFSTWHGLLGLVVVVYVWLQMLGGLPLLYPMVVRRWSLASIKRYHCASGLLLYVLGSVSLLLGMSSLWFTATVLGLSWYLLAVIPVITVLVIMKQVSNSYLMKMRFQS